MKTTQNKPSIDNIDEWMDSIPKELKEIICERLDKNPQITRLRKEYKQARQQFAIARASMIDKKLKTAIHNVVSDAMKEYEQEYMSIEKVFGHMEAEDSKTACYLFITLFFLTDMVESTIMDLDSLCKKINPEYKFMIGRDFLKILKMSKAKMRTFNENFVFFSYEKWGNEVDKLYQQVYNRAGIFTRAVLKEEKKKQSHETKE